MLLLARRYTYRFTHNMSIPDLNRLPILNAIGPIKYILNHMMFTIKIVNVISLSFKVLTNLNFAQESEFTKHSFLKVISVLK